MRIIHTVASLAASSGGPARTVTSLCSSLSTLGLQVSLVSVRSQGDIISPRNTNVDLTLLPRVGWLDGRTARSAISCTAIDSNTGTNSSCILHDHGIWLPINHFAAQSSADLSLPYMISLRGMLEPWSLDHKYLKKRLALMLYQRKNLNAATAFHATSELEHLNIRRLGFRQPIAVIPNGVDSPLLSPSTFARQKSAGRSTTSNTALFLSRIHPKKGIAELLKAWSAVRPENWKLLVVGPDEDGYLKQVTEMRDSLGLGHSVDFAGPADDNEKDRLFRDCQLFILPSHSENFGVVVAEALSYGVPVITTQATPWMSLLEHRCGWWIELTHEALASAIREATAMDFATRTQMGERAIVLAQRFNWHDIAVTMRSVYLWLLNKGSKPECIH